MSEIMRFTSDRSGYMLGQKDGGWVRYQDHLAEVERLTVERDNAQAGDDVALSALTSALRERDAAQAEIERLQARLTEAHERCGALELAVEQADEMKAHAEASAAAEEAETDRVTAELHAAQAEVERLKTLLTVERGEVATLRDRLWPVTHERDAAQAEVERLKDKIATTPTFINFPWDTYERLKNANEHLKEDVATLTAERDAAQAEVERLQANYKGMLDTSRPTDEDIWREAFMMAMQQGRVYDRITVADLALADYRKRWPR